MSIHIEIPEFPVSEPLPLDRARCSDGQGGLAHLFFLITRTTLRGLKRFVADVGLLTTACVEPLNATSITECGVGNS